MTVCYTWFHERFRVLPTDATEDTVRIYARAYIMMLLSSQLFADKNANRVHLRWLPYVASLEDLGRYSGGSAALAWWAEYLPRNDPVDQRVVAARLCLDRLRVHDMIRKGSASPSVGSEIDWLHAKDGRGGDRWFPTYYREWHQHWEDRHVTVIPVDRVADPGPSAEYLDWWCRVAYRFLSPEVAFQDPRPIVLTEEARHRGSSQAPPMVQVVDRPDNRRVDRRRRISTRTTDREWRWLADRLEEDQPRADHGGDVDYRVPRHRARRQGQRDGGGRVRGRGPSAQYDSGQHAVGEDIRGVATGMDQPTYDVGGTSQMFESVDPQAFADLLPWPSLPVDLNEPAAPPFDPWFALGGTPASAFSAVPSQAPVPQVDQRPRRVRRAPLCGTGGHLLGQFDDDDSDMIEDSD
ncbi:hypothetical protein Ahy_A09g046233 [Arachis hypogaea]|uniref:Aminotransferase-like plant mobile domain-containing protein n=1 Tax=Arachis hypogaea TaxID=3818 RepID=A0A445BP76_ARAHY|nr:hypothetical protein Ahy_A09g046233 [Arachis hypogaea]